jgi:hypothetical protein
VPATFKQIATYTVPSTTASYTFSSIPSDYTDIVLVMTPILGTDSYPYLRFNSDSTNKYTDTWSNGNGATAQAGRRNAQSRGYIAEYVTHETTQQTNIVVDIFSYANASTFKTYRARGNNTNSSTYTGTEVIFGTWASQSAITSITVGTAAGGVDYNLAAGTVISLYGIKAA